MVDLIPLTARNVSTRAIVVAPVVETKSIVKSPELNLSARMVKSIAPTEVKHLPGVHDQENHTTLAHRVGGGPMVMDNNARMRRSLNTEYLSTTPSKPLMSVGKLSQRIGKDNATVDLNNDNSVIAVMGPSNKVRALQAFGRRRTVTVDMPKPVEASVWAHTGETPMQIGGTAGQRDVHYTPVNDSHHAANGANTPYINIIHNPTDNPTNAGITALRNLRPAHVTAKIRQRKLPSVAPPKKGMRCRFHKCAFAPKGSYSAPVVIPVACRLRPSPRVVLDIYSRIERMRQYT